MISSLTVAIADRGSLSEALVGGFDSLKFHRSSFTELDGIKLPSKTCLVGYWSDQPASFFPEFMIVNDSDLADTYAWLSSYLNAFTPITQWCRIWTPAEFESLQNPLGGKSISGGIGPWVGAILAECVSRTARNVSIQELSGTATLASSSFAAARALAVWGSYARFADLAERYDELSAKLRDDSAQVRAKQLLPLWYALAGESWIGNDPPEARALQAFRRVFRSAAYSAAGRSESMSEVIETLRDEFDLPELSDCGSGPQPQRVEALDRLATRLANGPKSPVIEGILGFAASLIDPGAVALPDLLRRYSGTFPIAAIWAGAFAGVWSARRVLSDFGGLGRIVSKELLRTNDLFSPPSSDISFDELSRWLGPSSNDRFPVRGMVSRIINVELLPGAPAAFSISRAESLRKDSVSTVRQRQLDLDAPKRTERPQSLSLANVSRRLEELYSRIIDLEDKVDSPPQKKAVTKSTRRKGS